MRIAVKVKGRTRTWVEHYTIPDTESPRQWARELVERYNSRIQPGQALRSVVDVRVLGEGKPHTWVKTNVLAITGRRGEYHTYECWDCGAKATQPATGGDLTMDRGYRSEKYTNCPGRGKKEK